MSPRLGSLFAGIGGFELAGKAVGLDPVFTSEFDAACNRVLDVHFPDTAHLGDVTEIDGTLLPHVDVLTAGSPCQDFSIAGMRRGLAGSRSGLFEHFVRLIDEIQPRFAVWENVPGALTSSKGEDFANVIGALVGAGEPLPLPKHPSGRRSRYAGVARGPHGTLAWRVLDAQHFGVAQRRQRVFAVLDREGDRSIDILFPSGLPAGFGPKYGRKWVLRGSAWACPVDYDDLDTGMAPPEPRKVRLAEILEQDVDERYYLSEKACLGILRRAAGRGRALPFVLHFALWQQAGYPAEFTPTEGLSDFPEVVSALTQNGVGTCGADDNQAQAGHLIPVPVPAHDLSHALLAKAGAYYDPNAETFIPVMMKMRQGKPGGGKGPLLSEDLSLTVATGNDQYVFEAQTFGKVHRASSPTDAETWAQRDVSSTITEGDQRDKRAQDVVVEAIPIDTRQVTSSQGRGAGTRGTGIGEAGDPANTVTSVVQAVAVPPLYRVRRLTPVECERLQGFPDGWTDIKGAKDSHRYKQLGNAVAVPAAEWVLDRIAAVLR